MTDPRSGAFGSDDDATWSAPGEAPTTETPASSWDTPAQGFTPPMGSPSPYGVPPPASGTPPPSDGQPPTGQAPYGQAPYGQAPYGQAPTGQPPYGQPPYGQPQPTYPAPGPGYGPGPGPAYGPGPGYADVYGAPATGYPGYGYGYGPPAPRTESLATVSLVCSVVGALLICCSIGMVGTIAGVVTGFMARKKIAESGGMLTGDGMALAGIIVGSIVSVLYVSMMVFSIFAGGF